MGKKDLDTIFNVLTGYSNCGCKVELFRRMILDTDLRPHLKLIADSIVACIQSQAIFGNYRIIRLLLTGSMLEYWAESYKKCIGGLMWKQLEKELISIICSKQLRIHLSMSKADIYEDFFSDSCLLQSHKFQQVSSKTLFKYNAL